MKKIKFMVAVILSLCLSLAFVGCGSCGVDTSEQAPETDSVFKFTDNDMLRTYNDEIENQLAEKVILRGINAGGYLLIEQWMTALDGGEEMGYLDHKMTTDKFVERFGSEKTLELWQIYRDNFWGEQDFVNIADMGMNVIRLPFSYMNVDPEFNNIEALDGQKYNFRVLDEFVAKAAEYGIYTILDLHGAYGSQNGQDHSGEQQDREDIDFYENEEKQQKTIDLWGALAEHFKDNPAVAGYDILNEPGEHAELTTKKHWDFFDKVYKEIRAVDAEHIVMFESCWDGKDFPQPTAYGWENCVYSVHNYSWIWGSVEGNLQTYQDKIDGMDIMEFNVPVYMGEFNCFNNEESWTTTLELLNQVEWSWTSWTYKLNILDSSHDGWGIIVTGADNVNPALDSYDEIIAKWKNISTTAQSSSVFTFRSGESLYNIMKSYT